MTTAKIFWAVPGLLLFSGLQLLGCPIANGITDSDAGEPQSGDGGISNSPDSGGIATEDGGIDGGGLDGGGVDGGGVIGIDAGMQQENDAGDQIQCSDDLPFEDCSVDCSTGTCDPTTTEFYAAWQCFIQDDANFSCLRDDDCAVIDAPWFECDGISSGLFEKSGLAVNRSSEARASSMVSRYGATECLELRLAYGPSQNLPDGGRASGAKCNFDSTANIGRCYVVFEECYDACGVSCDGGE